MKCMMTFDLLLSFPDFNVTIKPTSTKVQEGVTVILNCTHNVPNGSISWLKDNVLQENENKEIFQIKYIQKTAVINCQVTSSCGNYNDTITIEVEGDCPALYF